LRSVTPAFAPAFPPRSSFAVMERGQVWPTGACRSACLSSWPPSLTLRCSTQILSKRATAIPGIGPTAVDGLPYKFPYRLRRRQGLTGVDRRLARGEDTAWCVRAASDVVADGARVAFEGIGEQPVALRATLPLRAARAIGGTLTIVGSTCCA
jgi:hypothetical protein